MTIAARAWLLARYEDRVRVVLLIPVITRISLVPDESMLAVIPIAIPAVEATEIVQGVLEAVTVADRVVVRTGLADEYEAAVVILPQVTAWRE
jgi:hypothetical protein